MADALPDFHQTVRPEWIDYNGHMSEAYYVLVFGHATDAMLAATGLGTDYVERNRCSLYTAEAHVRYLCEVAQGTALTVRTSVLGVDTKKVRFCHAMFAEGEQSPGTEPVATCELLGVHVDQQAGRSAPLPEEARARLAALVQGPPRWAGRAIGPVPKPL
jgi:acyl-CoA thioester hydrolase